MATNVSAVVGRRFDGIPPLAWAVVITTFIACVGGPSGLGYQIASLGWLIPLAVACGVLLVSPRRITFPYMLWVPWIALVAAHLVVADAPNALQRSVMLATPVIVGMAASTARIDEAVLDNMHRLIEALAVALWMIVLVKTGIYATGALPEITGLAAESITATLLCAFFAARFACGDKRALFWWFFVAAIPIVALTRTAMLLAILTLPLTFAPIKLSRRLFILVLVVTTAVGLFYTERVQQKMFFSGQGDFVDISRDNPDFRSTGRLTILDAMEAELELSPWYGNGANASEEFVSELTGGLTHPHNDWLRLQFDYGNIGVGIFLGCLILQLMDALRRVREVKGNARVLFYAAASSFVVFTGFMFTDNIILYAAFFGNLQFAMLGLAYAARASSPRGAAQERVANS